MVAICFLRNQAVQIFGNVNAGEILISEERRNNSDLQQGHSYFDMPYLQTKHSSGAGVTSHLPYPDGGTTDISRNDLTQPHGHGWGLKSKQLPKRRRAGKVIARLS